MKSPFDLTNKTIVIIGGAGLIGSEYSHLCASHGASVVIVEINAKKAETLAHSIRKSGGKAFAETCDTTNEESVQTLVQRITKRLKKVDGLVNTAHFSTGLPGKAPTDVSYTDFINYLNDHIGGPFLATR